MRLARACSTLSGRRALVTGGNSGIGEAMARALGLAGASRAAGGAARGRARRWRPARLRGEAIERATRWPPTCPTPRPALRGGARGRATARRHRHPGQRRRRQPAPALRRGHARGAGTQQLALHLGAPFFLTQALAPGMAAARLGPHHQHRLAAEHARLCQQRALRRRQGRRRAADARHRAGLVAARHHLQRDRPRLLSRPR